MKRKTWTDAHRTDSKATLPGGTPTVTLDGYYWNLKVNSGRKYDPGQPRVPAGNPDGGRWTSGSGTGRFRQTSSDFEPGQRVSWYAWTGGESQELVPGTVVRTAKVRVLVQPDWGDDPKWVHPTELHPGWEKDE